MLCTHMLVVLCLICVLRDIREKMGVGLDLEVKDGPNNLFIVLLRFDMSTMTLTEIILHSNDTYKISHFVEITVNYNTPKESPLV
jgi:hypothetical protein